MGEAEFAYWAMQRGWHGYDPRSKAAVDILPPARPTYDSSDDPSEPSNVINALAAAAAAVAAGAAA
ncbi:hypothetical protein COO60DRAFT_1643153 [Scenedesmus sp. NREL 46B-D3]|nr:hypothetical protein COO60DRAFT_1643153 [Scenedesmus sp. NREL 46B-D3]